MSFLNSIPNQEKSSVQVAVRIRPPNARESGTNTVANYTGSNIIITNPADGKRKNFAYNYMYPQSTTQLHIYNDLGNQVINNAFKGYNCCVFAYGQTGCFAKGTPVLTADYKYIPVEEVKRGMQLLGDDLTIRNVIRLFKGRQMMYRIKNRLTGEEQYVVNEDHIMVFKGTSGPIEMPLTDYIKLPSNQKLKYFCYTAEVKTKPSTVFPIAVERIGLGNYYGFMLDGNHRFLGHNYNVLRNSGKTHTMMGGNDEQAGLIPRICADLFNRQDDHNGVDQGNCTITYRVEISYLEIYAEQVRDLLTGDSKALRVRNHNEYGPYVEGLNRILVNDYRSIKHVIDRGNKHRTTAATLMNSRSSRSHAILILYFTQIVDEPDLGKSREIQSKINLVDLAGSERVEASGVTGINFKEAIQINQSLSTLALVIRKLVDRGVKKPKPVSKRRRNRSKVTTSASIRYIDRKMKNRGKAILSPKKAPKKKSPVRDHVAPFRDSILTFLLKESLGGNSKTLMVATISPSDLNYNQSLGTLRYASNASRIVNLVKMNEDPNDRIIRVLRQEIEELKGQISGPNTLASSVEVDQLREQLAQREALIREQNKSWDQKLNESKQIQEEVRKQIEEEYAIKQAKLKQAHVQEQKQLELKNQVLQEKLMKKDNQIEEKISQEKQEFLAGAHIEIQQHYEQRINQMRNEYEQRLIEKEQKLAEKTITEIDAVKHKNQTLTDELFERKRQFQIQARRFAEERGVLSKQIQQLKSKIHVMSKQPNKSVASDAEIKQKLEEYNAAKKLCEEEEKNYRAFQAEYRKLEQKVTQDKQSLEILNKQRENIKSDINLSTRKLLDLKTEYKSLQQKLEIDRHEYNALLLKKEVLHTEITELKTTFDSLVVNIRHSNPSTSDLASLRDGFESLLRKMSDPPTS